MMRLLGGVAVVIALFALPATAQDAAAALKPLQGRWVVTGGEHNGKPMDSLNGGVMTVSGDNFEIRTVSGNLLKGALRVDTSKRPFHMDLLHTDGGRWEAIYEVAADTFRMNYVDIELKEPRPASFTTSEKSEASVVTLRRESR